MQRLNIFIAAFSVVLLYFLSIIYSGLHERGKSFSDEKTIVAQLKRDFMQAHSPLQENQILKIMQLPRYRDYYLVHYGYADLVLCRNAIEVWHVKPQGKSVCVFNDGGLRNSYVENISFGDESDKIMLRYTIYNRTMKHHEVEVAISDNSGALDFSFVKGGEKAQ